MPMDALRSGSGCAGRPRRRFATECRPGVAEPTEDPDTPGRVWSGGYPASDARRTVGAWPCACGRRTRFLTARRPGPGSEPGPRPGVCPTRLSRPQSVRATAGSRGPSSRRSAAIPDARRRRPAHGGAARARRIRPGACRMSDGWTGAGAHHDSSYGGRGSPTRHSGCMIPACRQSVPTPGDVYSDSQARSMKHPIPRVAPPGRHRRPAPRRVSPVAGLPGFPDLPHLNQEAKSGRVQ